MKEVDKLGNTGWGWNRPSACSDRSVLLQMRPARLCLAHHIPSSPDPQGNALPSSTSSNSTPPSTCPSSNQTLPLSPELPLLRCFPFLPHQRFPHTAIVHLSSYPYWPHFNILRGRAVSSLLLSCITGSSNCMKIVSYCIKKDLWTAHCQKY